MVCKIGWDTLSPFVLALSHSGENFFEHKAAVITGGAKALTEIAREKNCPILGEFSCKGYDTFSPFKLVGGIAKGHPDERDLENARSFFRQIQNRLC